MARAHGTIVIEPERCKGCDLCVHFCPPRVLRLSHRRNTLNHRVVELFDEARCTGCEICARVCPDLAITAVYRERRPTTPPERRPTAPPEVAP